MYERAWKYRLLKMLFPFLFAIAKPRDIYTDNIIDFHAMYIYICV